MLDCRAILSMALLRLTTVSSANIRRAKPRFDRSRIGSGLDRFDYLPYSRTFETGQNPVGRAGARRSFAPDHHRDIEVRREVIFELNQTVLLVEPEVPLEVVGEDGQLVSGIDLFLVIGPSVDVTQEQNRVSSISTIVSKVKMSSTNGGWMMEFVSYFRNCRA
jgi:hypothetical protein